MHDITFDCKCGFHCKPVSTIDLHIQTQAHFKTCTAHDKSKLYIDDKL